MSTDTIRLAFTYAIAIIILAGCFVLLIFPSQLSQDQLVPFLTAIIGVVIGWVFNRESTTAGQRSAERAINQGAQAGLISNQAGQVE